MPISLTVPIIIAFTIMILRLWNRPFDSTIRQLAKLSDFIIAILGAFVGFLGVSLLENTSFTIGFNSDVDGIILASISILFTVLTYVTLNTASEVRRIANENKLVFKETEEDLIKFRAYMYLLSKLRQTEDLAEFDPQKEIEVRNLQSLNRLFESERECAEELILLCQPDRRDALRLVNDSLRKYIFSLPNVYPENTKIKTSVGELRMLL